ncbi:MAG: IS66 family transposase, partial [Verrucomicrobiaceae bacterium]|nr:IS66 family transposase [Verrucomicrobiaceae bacterium]
PKNLPVRTEEHIPKEVAAEPHKWRRRGEETTDQLEKEPGYFSIQHTARPKFIPWDQPYQVPMIKPAKPKIIDRGFWGPSLPSEVLTNKYLYHLPFYRQE